MELEMIQNAQFWIISVVAKLKKNRWKETYFYYVNIFLTHFEIMYCGVGCVSTFQYIGGDKRTNNSDGWPTYVKVVPE